MESPDPDHRAASILLVAALGLAFLAQGILTYLPELSAAGFAAYLASFVILAQLRRSANGTPYSLSLAMTRSRWLRSIALLTHVQLGLLLFAAVAVLGATAIANKEHEGPSYWWAFIAWILGLVAIALAFIYLPARDRLSSLRLKSAVSRWEVLGVLLLTLAAFGVRAFHLTTIPYPMAGDEASIGMEGQRILSGGQTNLFRTGWQSQPSMSFLVWALSQALFGKNLFGLRIAAAAVGALTVPAVYILARTMFNRSVAVVSAVVLAATSAHVHFSRLAVSNVENPLLACVVFWLVYRAVETRRVYYFAAGGVAGGFALYSFAGSRLVPLLAITYLLYAFLTDRGLWKEWPKFTVFCLCLACAVLPLAVFLLRHPTIAFDRMNQVGAYQTGWLAAEAARSHLLGVLVIAHTFWNSFRMFVVDPALQGIYNSPQPLYDPLWSLLLVLGLLWTFLDLKTRRSFLLHLWFWSVLFFGAALLAGPPQTERLVMAFPAVAIFIAVALTEVAALAGKILRVGRVMITAFTGAVAAALVATAATFYFLDYTPNHYFADANSEVGVELGTWLASHSRNARVYFFGLPRMFIGFPTIPFLTDSMPATDVQPGADVRKLVDPTKVPIFAALPNNRGELEKVRAFYPGGIWYEQMRRTTRGEVLFIVYYLPQPTI